ncbi:MAG: sigma-54-dependent Fis family transcriptional regulator [Desulfobacterales bacterium]|nr:sigma-54 dependent transcriptional regulator [Deltaproteobacteria bacterium]NNL76573.1 sigma-54-dependent Fis family transcriptional regulator [Desulfobacterales bacterium]
MESIPNKHTPILVVDDDEGLLLSIKATLVSSGVSEPALLSDSRNALALVRKHGFQLILLDLMMPHLNGLEVLGKIKNEFPNTECIIVSANDEIASAVQAMSLGASDYLVKPLNSEKLIALVHGTLEKHNLRDELARFGRKKVFSELLHPQAFTGMVAEDESMALVFHQVEAVAGTDYSVVIDGESGTGKEMLARVIHGLSNRSKAPFYAVNMASFSKTIFEDEFFGHAKGAYTDASSDRRGFFEAAHGGTLFLDEITELDPSLQAKLLRVIEEREFYRLGSTEIRNVDVRIIAATNRDINEEIIKGRFRADLFYRINMYNIKIPPLRERKDDILPLAAHFLKIHASANKKRIQGLTPDLAEKLVQFSFPGNVRELENMIAAAVLLENGKTLTLASVRNLIPYNGPERRRQLELLTLSELEKRHIERVLKVTGGNRPKAAKILGVNVTTVYRKIEKYNISEKN